MKELLILVDKDDREIGCEEKLIIHQKGLLHRAFSIFIFNSKKELLLQQRALSKYHSAGLWTNACCGHPRCNEDLLIAANRRLAEEMGIITPLKELFSFVYNVKFGDNLLVEHELDHIFVGEYELDPVLNKQEAMAYRWVSMDDVLRDVQACSGLYTYWFRLVVAEVVQKY